MERNNREATNAARGALPTVLLNGAFSKVIFESPKDWLRRIHHGK